MTVDFSTPTETAPQACLDREYFSYDALNQLISDASDALSLELYLQQRLNAACGDSASELASISTALQAQVTAATTAKDECIAEFFELFGAEAEDLETYTAAIETAYADADIPERDTEGLVPELPDVPETCQDFVDSVTEQIDAQTEALVECLDKTDFIIDTVCTGLNEAVGQIEIANEGAVTEISGRIGLVLADILAIEGLEGEDIPGLEMRLRAEFALEEEKATFDSGITLPSESLPVKCVEYTSYANLEDLIAFIEDTLSFEDWLKDRLQESCGTAGEEYQVVIDGLQAQIDDAAAAKQALVDELFANFGGDLTRAEYEQQLDDAFTSADIESTFINVDVPDAPESCSSITNPLFLEINTKRIELIVLTDCIAFSTEDVCTALDTDVDAVIDANTAQLTDKGAAVIAKLNVLRAVDEDSEQDPEAFALALRGEYEAAVAAGEFEPVAADFTTPTETFPEACADFASYDALNQLIADVSDACSWDAWLQETINAKAAESIAAHNAEIARIAELAQEAEAMQDTLIAELFEQFNTGDQTLEAFELFIRTEFEELSQANALPEKPVDVETEIPAIPAGLEPLVEGLRNTIAEDATALGSILDFNNFAFDFICEEAIDDIDAATVVATEQLEAAAEELGSVIDDLFIVEGTDDQDRVAFESQLRDEWEASVAETQLAQVGQVELPYDSLPSECVAGQQKLQALRDIIQDTQDISDFTEWLRPRIDDAAVILLTCTQTKADLADLIMEDFSKWTTCVNDKSAILQTMWGNDADVTFLDFLADTRQRFEDLKDADMVHIIDPELEIPAVLSQCPDDVQEQLGVAESFVDILEDCGTYLAWLQAQAGGFCEVPQFEAVAVDNADAAADAAASLEITLDDLFDVNGQDDESREDFLARQRAEFDAAEDVNQVVSGIVVPETSLACPDDATDAHAAAVQFVEDLNDALTYDAWLKAILQAACDDIEGDYDAIRAIAEPKLAAAETERDAYINALWVFKGIDAIEGVTEAETLEEFTERLRTQYDNEETPTVVPVMSVETFLHVPSLCDDETIASAAELVELVADLNDANAYTQWMKGELAKCEMLEEMNIRQKIADIEAMLATMGIEKQEQLDDLWSFTALDGESMSDFTDRMFAEFDAHLDSSEWELEETGFTIPDVPELADDETEALRDELVDAEYRLAYCKTFVSWLKEEIFVPCEVLRVSYETANADNLPRVAASQAQRDSYLASLKQLKDDDNLSQEDFDALMLAEFTTAAPESVASGIDILPAPIVCQQETLDARDALVDLEQEITDAETYQQWLKEQTEECCQDLGIEYVNIRKQKEETLEGLNADIAALVADIAAISDRDEASLAADFDTASAAGDVTAVPDETVLEDTPENCQQSTVDARQAASDACDDVSDAQTYKAWLETELETECTTEIDDLDAIIAAETPRLTAGNAMKADLFETWWVLEALENETLDEFIDRQTAVFNAQFDPATAVSAGMLLNNVPETCAQDTQDKYQEALDFVADLEMVLTFCDWLEAEKVRACGEQREAIMATLLANMDRLDEVEQAIESVLGELMAEKPEGATNMAEFAALKEGQFIMASPTPTDTGIVVPAVPDGCSDETKMAGAALQAFQDELEDKMTYYDFLQGLLQECCEQIETEINGLFDGADDRIQTCAAETFSVLTDLSNLRRPADVLLETFTQELRAEYVALGLDQLDTGIEIPSLPVNCDQDSQDALLALREAVENLSDCLTFKQWLEAELQEACIDCEGELMDSIDDNWIILQAAELRIIDQQDNLYLLEDPVDAEGNPQAVSDFQDALFVEWEATNPTGEETGIEVKIISEDCPVNVQDLAAELTDLRTAIGRAFAYENWIKMQVMQALIGTEGELSDILSAERARSTEAADTVVMALSEIFWVKGEDDETADAFAARMKVKFDKEIDDATVTFIETGIEIPDLPMNAAPSTVNARRLLVEFDDTLSYQLTWAQWLVDMLEDCCDDVADAYDAIVADNSDRQAAAVARTTEIMADLLALDGEGEEANVFATAQRAAFEAGQLNPDTAVDVVDSLIIIDVAPQHCQDSTYDARDALQDFSDALSDLLTFNSFLESQLAGSCATLSDDFVDEKGAVMGALTAKELELTATLENLFQLDAEEGEDFETFRARVRGNFDAEGLDLLDGGFTVADVPVNCNEDTFAMQGGLEAVIGQYNDCLTFQEWVVAQLVTECDEFAAECQAVIDNIEDPQIVALLDDLFVFKGTEGQTSEEFATALFQDFDAARSAADSDVVEQETGIEIPEVPEQCQQSTKDTKDALIVADNNLQNQLTFAAWLEEELAAASQMNAEECDDLAESYQTIIADGAALVTASQDRQTALKADAYLIKGQDGETFEQFQMRFKEAFNTYVPIPVTPDVSFTPLPGTCQQSTRDARQELQDFLDALSMELTYEDWVANELKDCCADLVGDLNALVDQDRITDLENLKDDILADLFTLQGADGQTAEDFNAANLAAFEAAEVADIDTGVVRPVVPESCNDLDSDITAANAAFNEWADTLQTCENRAQWLGEQLSVACEVPTGEAQAIIDSETPRIAAAQEAQQAALEALFVFKGIAGETVPQFDTRLRTVFDRYVTHRRNTGIVVPTFPAGCTDTAPVVAELEALVEAIADEETFLRWLQANLKACCDDREEDILHLIAVNAPSVAGLEQERDQLVAGLFAYLGEEDQTLEEFTLSLDQTYGDALIAGEVLEGYTSIKETVPAVPTECDERVVTAQQQLIAIADAIEALEAQIGYLQPLLDAECIASEPALQDILDGVTGVTTLAQVGQTEELNQAKFESLFVMLGEDGETIEDFEARITADVEGLLSSGELSLLSTGIEIPPTSALCPSSTTTLGAAAVAFERNLALQLTLGPWIDNEIAETCDANAVAVSEIIAATEIIRDEAIIVSSQELARGLNILGEDGENTEAFATRMQLEFTQGPAIPEASGLPAFSEDCDAEDSAELEYATNVINQANSFEAFNVFLREEFTDECSAQETDMSDLIDAAGLATLESEQEAMVNMWFEICDDCTEDNLDDFIRRLGQEFVDSETTFDSGIEVPAFPEDCLEYVETIGDTQAALALYKQQLEFNRAFDSWATPQFEALQARLCAAAASDLGFQTSGLDMMIDSEIDVNSPLIEDFLFVLDPAAEGETVEDYSENVVTSEILFGDSGVEPTAPQEADTPLPDFCPDTSSQEDFDAAAQELAAQITRTEWAEFRVGEICAEQAAELAGAADAINGLVLDQQALIAAQTQVNYDLASLAGNAGGDLDAFALGSQTAYGFDADFVASGSGVTVTDVPAGFCDAQVYADLQAAQDALAELEAESAYAEWLADQEANLAADAITYLETAEQNGLDVISATEIDIDDILGDIVTGDAENEIFANEQGYLDYLLGEFNNDADFERQNIVTDLEEVPSELPASLDDQDNEIPTLLPNAVTAVNAANDNANFVEWLVAEDRVPTECVDNCCIWRQEIRTIESGAADTVATILAGLEPGQDSEDNRAAFAATMPEISKYTAPALPDGEVCLREQEYLDRFEDATY